MVPFREPLREPVLDLCGSVPNLCASRSRCAGLDLAGGTFQHWLCRLGPSVGVAWTWNRPETQNGHESYIGKSMK